MSETEWFPKILLVDDHEANLLALRGFLRHTNAEMLFARSGEEALELLLVHEAVALAIVDVQMPGMNGFELAELMRGVERTRPIPILFLTAGDQDAVCRFRGDEAAAVDVLYKPIEPETLRRKVDRFLKQSRQREILARSRNEQPLMP